MPRLTRHIQHRANLAAPEAEALLDDMCRRRFRLAALPVTAVAAVFILSLLTLAAAFFVLRANNLDPLDLIHAYGPAGGITAMALTYGVPTVLAAVAFGLSRRRLVLAELERVISTYTCINCGYDLRGLPAEPNATVRCPECGTLGVASHAETVQPPTDAP